MKKIFPYLLILLVIFISACSDSKKENTYTYQEFSEYNKILKQDTILAENDTLAYKKAFQKFFISQRALKDVRMKMEENGIKMPASDEPASFAMYDDNGKPLSKSLLSDEEIAEIASKVNDVKID